TTRKEVPCHDGLDPGSGVLQGSRPVSDAACPHRLAGGARRACPSSLSHSSTTALEEATIRAALPHPLPASLREGRAVWSSGPPPAARPSCRACRSSRSGLEDWGPARPPLLLPSLYSVRGLVGSKPNS